MGTATALELLYYYVRHPPQHQRDVRMCKLSRDRAGHAGGIAIVSLSLSSGAKLITATRPWPSLCRDEPNAPVGDRRLLGAERPAPPDQGLSSSGRRRRRRRRHR